MAERLAERRVFVDWRPGAGLRMSPHFFNTDEEIEEALNILAELIIDDKLKICQRACARLSR